MPRSDVYILYKKKNTVTSCSSSTPPFRSFHGRGHEASLELSQAAFRPAEAAALAWDRGVGVGRGVSCFVAVDETQCSSCNEGLQVLPRAVPPA